MTTATKPHFSLFERQCVLDALAASPGRKPMDAYQLSKELPGHSPMTCGQILHELQQDGCVVTKDPLGTANDLAASFTVASNGR